MMFGSFTFDKKYYYNLLAYNNKFHNPFYNLGCRCHNPYIQFCDNCIKIGVNMNGVNLTFKNFWGYTRKNLVENIVYNFNSKPGVIKRIIIKCEQEIFQMKKEIRAAENQLGYFKMLEVYFVKYKSIVSHNRFYDDYIQNVREQKETCCKVYSLYKNYYYKLPQIKEKYEKLLAAIKSRTTCCECFNNFKSNSLKNHKSKKFCRKCYDKVTHKEIIRDCPVCFDSFKEDDVIETKCGGSHYLCKSCYKGVQSTSSKCPMCRGIL